MKVERDRAAGRRRPDELDGDMRPGGTSSRSATSPRPTPTRSSSGSSADKPDLVNSIRAEDLPESFRVVPNEGRARPRPSKQRVPDRAGRRRASSTPGEALKGLIDVTNTVRWIFVGHLAGAAGVVAVPHREHDPPRDVRASPRDRGDEARRRVELVRAHAVPRRGDGPGLRRRRASRSSRWCASSTSGSTRRSATRGQFFSEFFVTQGDAVRISIIVLLVGMLIGTLGAVVGLRRFLRT